LGLPRAITYCAHLPALPALARDLVGPRGARGRSRTEAAAVSFTLNDPFVPAALRQQLLRAVREGKDALVDDLADAILVELDKAGQCNGTVRADVLMSAAEYVATQAALDVVSQ
jgi:hypothetical protein